MPQLVLKVRLVLVGLPPLDQGGHLPRHGVNQAPLFAQERPFVQVGPLGGIGDLDGAPPAARVRGASENSGNSVLGAPSQSGGMATLLRGHVLARRHVHGHATAWYVFSVGPSPLAGEGGRRPGERLCFFSSVFW